MSVKPKTAGGFYREEAARLASEAAKAPPGRPAKPGKNVVPPIELDRRERGPLRPGPAVNQNIIGDDPIEPGPLPPRYNALRTVAWVLLAPWYAAMLAASLGVDAWFVKDLLGF